MQRVVRSTLAVLTLASLAACGDKVTIPPQVIQTTPATTPVVHGVTVSPTQASMNVGDKITISASVNADSPLARTVTWKSSDATIASVDASTGLVTAIKAGTASITATSTADASQSASAVVTVGGGANGAVATVTISSINQTVCGGLGGGCASVPANLANVVGQVDVTLNVDPGAQRLLGVDLVLNCPGNGNSGKDTVVASQTLASANVAPAAEAAAAPVTLSFNTASFNSTTGATLFKNGSCTVKAVARTNSSVGGAVTTTTSTGLSLTLANPDVIVGTVTAGTTALNPNTGLSWNGKSVTVNTIPVFFSNRTSAQTMVTFEGRTVHLGAGAQSVTFVDRNDPSIGPVLGGAVTTVDSLDIDGITDAAAAGTLAINIIDSNGQAFANAGGILASTASYLTNPAAPATVFTQPFRLDTQKPVSGLLLLGGNALQGAGAYANGGAYLNGSFRFANDSAAGFVGPDRLAGAATCTSAGVVTPTNVTSNCDVGGVDSVTVQFFSGAVTSSGTIGTATKVTNASGLAETNTNSADAIFQISTDRLGNADTSVTCNVANYTVGTGCGQYSTVQNVTGLSTAAGQRFGVDKTAPTQAFTAGELNQATYQSGATPGNYFLTITDAGTVGGSGVGTYAGPGSILVSQTRQWNGLRTATFDPTLFENHVYSNMAVATPGAGSALRTNTEVLKAVGSENSGCIIGRFNASQTKATANAQPVYGNDGTIVGYCSPVAFTPTAVGPSNSLGLPSDATAQVGYFRTTVVPTDVANNTGAAFTSAILADANAPVVTSIDIPQTIAGNSTVTFPAAVNDTTPSRSSTVGDIVGSWATLVYPTATLQYAVTAGPGVAFDNALTNVGTVSAAVPNFIKNLQSPNGGAPAATTANTTNASSVQVTAIDAANNVSANAAIAFNTQPVQFTGSASSFAGFASFTIAASNANGTNVQNCPAAGCGAGTANPSNITVTATASGPTGTFNNPFSTTQLWYRVSNTTTWFMATSTQAVAGAVTSSDNGQAVAGRSWIYTFTFDPPASTPASTAIPAGSNLSPAAGQTVGLDVMVIGVNGNGDAVATPVQQIVLTNP